MTGVGLEAKVDAELAIARLAKLSPDAMSSLADAIGQMIENQTKRRIVDEKTSPDGDRWAPWSEAYDETRNHAKHSLLVGEGSDIGLFGSIQNYFMGGEIKVGTNLIYGAIHQFGGGASKTAENVASGAMGSGIPARPYLGLSGENRADIEQLVIDKVEGLLQ